MQSLSTKTFLFTLALVGLAQWVFADTGALKVLKGSIYVQHAQKNLWEPVKNTAAVDEGDQIKTSNDSRGFLTLGEHKVAIGPDTHIALQRVGAGETKIYLKTGAVRNKVH